MDCLPSPVSTLPRVLSNTLLDHPARTHNGSDSQHASPKSVAKKRVNKAVPSACSNCQKAHLACDLSRPCKRCVSSGRSALCVNAVHKKRGRPKRQDKPAVTVQEDKTAVSMVTGSSHAFARFPPGFARSSFSMTMTPGESVYRPPEMTIVTFILSMDICCARVSEEAATVLGVDATHFIHRSLYEFVSPAHAERLAHAHRSLLDNVVCIRQATADCTRASTQPTLPPTRRTTTKDFANASPSALLSIANGSQTILETISFETGSETRTLQARFYLGGGFGADLYSPETLGDLYIVCLAIQESAAQQPDAQTLSTAASETCSERHSAHAPSFASTSPMDMFDSSRFESISSLLAHTPVSTTADAPIYLSLLNSSIVEPIPETESFLTDNLLMLPAQEACLSPFDTSPSSLDTSSPPSSLEATTTTSSDSDSDSIRLDVGQSQTRSMKPSPQMSASDTQLGQLTAFSFFDSPGMVSTAETTQFNSSGTSTPGTITPSFGLTDPLWTHPNEMYYMKTSSSHLSAEASAFVNFKPYHSPSPPMVALLREKHTIFSKSRHQNTGISRPGRPKSSHTTSNPLLHLPLENRDACMLRLL